MSTVSLMTSLLTESDGILIQVFAAATQTLDCLKTCLWYGKIHWWRRMQMLLTWKSS